MTFQTTTSIDQRNWVESFKRVKSEAARLETQSATAHLIAHDLPHDQLAVQRLVFARYLALSLRTNEQYQAPPL